MLELLTIIWEVISSTSDPDVSRFEMNALGWLGLAAGAQGLGSIFKGRAARNAMDDQMLIMDNQIDAREELQEDFAEQARQGEMEADAAIADALAERRGIDYGVAPTYSELRRAVNEDRAADLQREEALRSEAEQIRALQTGGARALLGGLNQVDASTADRFAKIAADESARRRAGLETIASAEQRAKELEAAQAFAGTQSDLAFGRALKEGAIGAKQDAMTMDVDIADATAQAQSAQVQGDLARRQGITSGLTDAFGSFVEVGLENNLFGEEGMSLPEFEMGGMTFEEGAALMRGETPGEFSHDKNPIDIMKDGAKIGEMTGGEGIVSPEDMGKMEQLAGKGDTPLHKFVRSWFKKINKKKV